MKGALLLFIILLFICCKKNGEPDLTADKIPFLSQIYVDNNLYKAYFYNNAWQPVAIRTYNIDTNNFALDSFFYNSKNKVDKYSTFAKSGHLIREYRFEYDTSGKISREKKYFPHNGQLINDYYYDYYYHNMSNIITNKVMFRTSDNRKVYSWRYGYDERGNLIKYIDNVHINRSDAPTPSLYVYFEYDNLINSSLWFDCNDYTQDFIPVVNNVTKATYTQNMDTMNNRSYNAVFTYSPESVPLTEKRTYKDLREQFLTYKYIYR